MRVPAVLFAGLVAAAAFTPPAAAHGPASAPSLAPRHPLVAWHPRPWRPPGHAIAAGLRVEVDPATGEMVEPRTNPVALETAIGRMREAGLTVVTRADGSRSVVVGDRLHRWSVVSTGPDGALRHECVSSGAAAVERARAAATRATGGR